MSNKYDVIIIGAGILGCFAARHLSALDLNIAVLEKNEDVCTGITRANSGIIYRGYDQHPGSLKAQMCVRAAKDFEALCRQLSVSYRKCGLLMLSFGPQADRVLEKKIRHAESMQIPDVSFINKNEVYALEPALADGVQHALYAPSTCVADPWELGIAAFENAKQNGVDFYFREKVLHMEQAKNGSKEFTIETESSVYYADRVLCCAGLHSDELWEMLRKPRVRIIPQDADYMVFDTKKADIISHIISVEPEEKGDGLTLIPTVRGNILMGPTRRPHTGDSRVLNRTTEEEGLQELIRKCRKLIPSMPIDTIIRSFGAVRPNPYLIEHDETGDRISSKSVNDFLILEEAGLFALIGVKTPGITCANELGAYMAKKIRDSFTREIGTNRSFDPTRRGIQKASELTDEERAALVAEQPAYGEVICRCKDVTRGEILEAIRRGAKSVDGIKRRTGAGMGRCQGGYCLEKILPILAKETGTDIYAVLKDEKESEILRTSKRSNRS